MTYLQTLKHVFIDGNRYMYVLKGLQFSLGVTVLSAVIGLVLGVVLAMMRISRKHKFLNSFAVIYIDVVRGTPVIVQLMILANLVFVGHLRNVPVFMVASVAFGLNSAAYVAEIIRAGINSIERGQMDAARAVGMTYRQAMRVIILPQAIKRILPSLVNEFIVLIKETSVVGFIGGVDLLRSANIITSQTYRGVEPLLLVGLIYLILISGFTVVMRKIEERLRASD